VRDEDRAVTRTRGRRALLGLLAAVLAVLGVAAVPASAGDEAVTVPLVHDGTLRSYRLYVPDTLPPLERVPLLLVMHGLGSSAAGIEAQTGFDALADEHGFVVAYPDGLWHSWNAGGCCGDASAARVDDAGFLASVAAEVALTLPVDPSRVYLAGFSNGGMMALRAACERPDVFAAVASMAGTLVAPCTPVRPVSVLQVAGGLDTVVPYRGQAWSLRLSASLPAVPIGSGTWERADLCSGLPTRVRTAHAEVRSYDRCAGGSAARVVLLPAMSHVWPTLERDGWAGSAEVWRFLAGRVLPDTADRPSPVLATRVVAARDGRYVAGRLDGRYDVVIGRRLVVEVPRGRGWAPYATVTTDVEGRFRFVSPRSQVRVRYAGTPGLPSSVRVA